LSAHSNIAQQRLNNQQLIAPTLKRPDELVRRLGAIQAQDYHGAQWAVGQRLQKATSETVEKAFSEGRILRTHVMRPTWHFVAATDIRWLLKLTAPRVNAVLASQYRKYELDEAVFRRCNKALAAALSGGKHLTRERLREKLQRAGISAPGVRFLLILARAEVDAVICSGARMGKQFTYALLDERVPAVATLTHDEALAELTRRYFASRGPATAADFAWWSGLTVVDVKAGLNLAERRLVRVMISNKAYYSSSLPVRTNSLLEGRAHLLPTYDEYLIGYKDRDAAGPSKSSKKDALNFVFRSPIVIGGAIVGSWRRSVRKDTVEVKLDLLRRLSEAEKRAVVEAANRYGEFLGKKALL